MGKITFVAYFHIPTYIHGAKANSLRTSYSFFSSAIPFSALKFHSSTFEEWERGEKKKKRWLMPSNVFFDSMKIRDMSFEQSRKSQRERNEGEDGGQRRG